MGKTDTDDEEEWGRSLILQINDSDEDTWLDESSGSESEQEESIMLKAPDKEIRREDSKNKNFSEDLISLSATALVTTELYE